MYFIVGEETVFLHFLRFPGWVWKLNWKRQINRRKAYRFYYTLTCIWDTSQDNEYPKKWPEHKAFIRFTQTIHLGGIDKTEGFRLGLVNAQAVTRKVRIGLTPCACTDSQPQMTHLWWLECLLPPCMWRVPFAWESCDLFQGRKVRTWMTEWSPCFCCVLKFL